MSVFSWRLAVTLAAVHLIVTMSVWSHAFANVFGRRFGEFAAAMKHQPPPPHVRTTAEALLSILVQPVAYVLQELQIKPMLAYLGINSLFWGIVLALLIGFGRLCCGRVYRAFQTQGTAEVQPERDKNGTPTRNDI